MTVTITIETNSARHADLDKKIWEKFPDIGGIEKYNISYRQYTLTFELGAVTREQFQKFLDSEGLTGNFQPA